MPHIQQWTASVPDKGPGAMDNGIGGFVKVLEKDPAAPEVTVIEFGYLDGGVKILKLTENDKGTLDIYTTERATVRGASDGYNNLGYCGALEGEGKETVLKAWNCYMTTTWEVVEEAFKIIKKCAHDDLRFRSQMCRRPFTFELGPNVEVGNHVKAS